MLAQWCMSRESPHVLIVWMSILIGQSPRHWMLSRTWAYHVRVLTLLTHGRSGDASGSGVGSRIRGVRSRRPISGHRGPG